jgi:hypothetical protein
MCFLIHCKFAFLNCSVSCCELFPLYFCSVPSSAGVTLVCKDNQLICCEKLSAGNKFQAGIISPSWDLKDVPE